MNFEQRTRQVFVGSKFLISPLEAMYGLLIFIFCKDLNATPFQITLLVSSKPLVALISFYSNLFIQGNPHRLRTLIIGSHILGCLPCFFFPFVNNPWFFLFSFALFMMSLRAMIPAWSEILKINLPNEVRAHVFSMGSTTNYVMSTVVPLLLAPLIDFHPHAWKWIFFVLALLQMINVALIFAMQINKANRQHAVQDPYQMGSAYSVLIGPWKNGWDLMRQRPDFRNFQIVFLFGGAGLMVMQPVLPIFFKDNLGLSYTELTIATILCKGLAFAVASPLWARWFNRQSIHLFNCLVTLVAAIFAGFIIVSDFQLGWLYVAYLIYGWMQAGSELSWNLSGPLFSPDKDSTLFTGVNVAMVGVRGAIAPLLGGLLFMHSNAYTVFLCGGLLCFIGSIYSFSLASKEQRLKDIDEVKS